MDHFVFGSGIVGEPGHPKPDPWHVAAQTDRHPEPRQGAHKVKTDYEEDHVWRCKCGHDHESEPCVIIGDEIHQRCEACMSFHSCERVEVENDG